MHRPAAPARASRRAAQNFGQQVFERTSARKIMTVRAMPAPHRIAGFEGGAYARGNRLLADIQMTGAARFPAFDQRCDRLFGQPDTRHPVPAFEQPVDAERRSVFRDGRVRSRCAAPFLRCALEGDRSRRHECPL